MSNDILDYIISYYYISYNSQLKEGYKQMVISYMEYMVKYENSLIKDGQVVFDNIGQAKVLLKLTEWQLVDVQHHRPRSSDAKREQALTINSLENKIEVMTSIIESEGEK